MDEVEEALQRIAASGARVSVHATNSGYEAVGDRDGEFLVGKGWTATRALHALSFAVREQWTPKEDQ